MDEAADRRRSAFRRSLLDGWRDGYKDLTNRFYAIGAGIHTMRVEYYERTGNAAVRVWWYEDLTNSPR